MRTKNICDDCKKDVHCCMFKGNIGFTFVGLDDAKRIRKATKKDYSDFLDYSPLPKKVVDILKRCDPSVEGALRYSMLDNNRILRLKTENERCIFLDKDNKCIIYDVRPNICRIYPYWAIRLDDNKLKIIPHDIDNGCKIADVKDINEEKLSEIRKLFKAIEKEARDYNKDIKKFVKISHL